MKRIIGTILLTATFCILHAQEPKKESKSLETKMDAFISKTGTITKFLDFKLSGIKTKYSTVETRIRKVTSGSNTGFFYQIEKEGKYANNTASIEYSDLIEVLKALASLKISVEKDISSNPDYLENKFISTDGFEIGYYVSKGKCVWYIKLEKYGSDTTIFIDDVTSIENSFSEAKLKIEQVKKL